MLDRQLLSLYSALDKSPNSRIALRVRHPERMTWAIQRRKLTIGTEVHGDFSPIDLCAHSVQSLSRWLEDHGFQILYLDLELASRNAAALLAGRGGESLSNGDALYAYDSLLWSLLDAYALELEGTQDNIDAALLELYIESADGEWLDYWGEFFGLPRGGRTDDVYRRYLIDETLRPRSNAIAIEKAVKELLSKVIRIYEPWKDMFILDESALSDAHHFQDGNFYTYNVIQPTSVEPIDWTDVLPVIRRNKPAGVVVAAPGTIFPARILNFPTEQLRILRSSEHVHTAVVVYEDRARMSYWALDSEVIRNYAIFSTDIQSHETVIEFYSTPPSSRPTWDGHWDTRPWSGSHAFYLSSEGT